MSGNGDIPPWVEEIGDAVDRFFRALWSLDEETLAECIAPDSYVDWIYRIWGAGPPGMSLRLYWADQFVFVLDERELHLQSARTHGYWVSAEDDEYLTIEGTDVVVHLRYDRNQWRVSDIQQGTLEEPTTLEIAQRIIDQVTNEELMANQEKWSPLATETGAFQSPREGYETLDDVETLLLDGMAERGFSLRERVSAVRIWRDYKEKATPRYRKPGVYAAALEYITAMMGFWDFPQKEIARIYGVSPNTVGQRTSQIERSLQLVKWDERYCCYENPHPELWARVLESPFARRLGLDKLGDGRRSWRR